MTFFSQVAELHLDLCCAWQLFPLIVTMSVAPREEQNFTSFLNSRDNYFLCGVQKENKLATGRNFGSQDILDELPLHSILVIVSLGFTACNTIGVCISMRFQTIQQYNICIFYSVMCNFSLHCLQFSILSLLRMGIEDI